jgi:hypothetical protein
MREFFKSIKLDAKKKKKKRGEKQSFRVCWSLASASECELD